MRISEIAIFRVSLPMICGRYSCTNEPGVENAEVVIVRIETDEGIVGYGETGALGGYPAYAASIEAGIAELAQRHLIGQELSHVERILENILRGQQGYLKSALDIACWDILGKKLGVPVYQLLGGQQQKSIPLYRSISIGTPEQMIEDVETWRKEGYQYFQLRIGTEPSLDIERILAVLARKQSGEIYTVDTAGRWHIDQALYVLKAVKETHIIVEQPCWAYEDCLFLRNQLDFSIKLDNSINGIADVLRAHRDNACDSIVLKVDKVGGLTQARIIRDLCSAIGIVMTIDDNWGSEIGMAAVAHLAISTRPDMLLNTTDIHNYSSVNTATAHFQAKNGIMTLTDAPGLGIEVDTQILGEPNRVFRQ